jgi:TPR repeat protein
MQGPNALDLSPASRGPHAANNEQTNRAKSLARPLGKDVSTENEAIHQASRNHYQSLLSDPQAALQNLEALAATNDLGAIATLSMAYLDGVPGVPADFMKAYKYAKLGASLNESASIFALARIQHRAGELEKAAESARAAHEAGWPDAGIMYARMLLKGEGTAKSPLEALAILSELAKSNVQAAVECADYLLDARGIPQSAQRAYELLVPHEPAFDALDRSLRIQAYMAMAMCLLRNSKAASPLGRSTDFYTQEAAKLGDKQANAQLNDRAQRDKQMALAEEWDQLASFGAYGGKWEMFTKAGKLDQIENKQNTGMHTMGDNLYANTVRWNELHFRGANEQFTVRVDTKVSAVNQRDHVVLYVGPQGSGSGVPVMVFDPAGGHAYPTTANVQAAYRENWSKWTMLQSWSCFAGAAYGLLNGISMLPQLFWGRFGTSLLGVVLLVLGVFAAKRGFTLRKRFNKAGYKEALAKASKFIGRHGSSLTAAG